MEASSKPTDKKPAATTLTAGTSVDRYTVEALIGRGGMGEVYRAVDERLRRKVALKVVRGDTDGAERNPDGVARLFREARAAAALAHPNAVAIHDLGEADGLFYIVMELVSGQPLLAYVGDERVSIARRLKWLGEIARALATAHAKGVIHRDVKPSNVMISDEDVAKVLDFGLAKPIHKSGAAPESMGFRTLAGRILGTVRYMAPEQMLGAEADGRADQYALGMTAYELLAGRHPSTKQFEPPPMLDKVVSGFPADGAKTIARMLSRHREDRFPSMEDVVSAFEDIAQNRPVRALAVVGTVAPARVDEPSVVETMPEPPIGSTLTSAVDDLSADSRIAAEEALMPTVTPSQLAAIVGSGAVATPGKDEPAPAPAPAPENAAASAAPARSADGAVASPRSADGAVAPRAVSTLASAKAGDAVLAVRAKTKVSRAPLPVESVPPPAPAAPTTTQPDTPAEVVATKPSPDAASAPKKRSNNAVIFVVTVLFLALAAFAGNYMGARSRAP